MSGSSFNFGNVSQSSSGDGAVNQIGDNKGTVATSVTKGGPGELDLEKLLQVIEQSVAEVEAEEPPPSAKAPIGFKPADPPFEPLDLPEMRSFAQLPPAIMELPENQGRLAGMISKLKKYGPAIAKNCAVFGAGALEALATMPPTSPLVNGVLQVCKANMQPKPSPPSSMSPGGYGPTLVDDAPPSPHSW